MKNRMKRGEKTRIWQMMNAALDDAERIFSGTKDDRGIWARIAWRVGLENFLDVIYQAESEARDRNKRIPNSQLPRFFQSVLNRRFPKPS